MNEDVRLAISLSARMLQEVVWPVMGPLIGGGRLIPVETVTSVGFALELDQLAGVDAWHVVDSVGAMRPLASRVQYLTDRQPPYETFTIRLSRPSGFDTELQKLTRALYSDKGYLHPHIHCHAYVRRNELVSAAIARTEDVVDAIHRGMSFTRPNLADGAWFHCVPWKKLAENDKPMVRWPQAGLWDGDV